MISEAKSAFAAAAPASAATRFALGLVMALTASCGAAPESAGLDGADVEEEIGKVSQAAQYQRGAAYTYWNQVSGQTYTDWTQEMVVTQQAPNTFWNIFGEMVLGPGWYLGVQTPDGEPRFHFSMWDATASSSASPTVCTPFEEVGAGQTPRGIQCSTPVGESLTNKTIRLTMIKSNRSNPADLWWSAWAEVRESRRSFYLGQLRAPYQGAIRTAMNFTEYFGEGGGWDGSTCVPPFPPNTQALYGQPTVSSPALPAQRLTYASGELNTCPGPAGQSLPFLGGGFHRLGT